MSNCKRFLKFHRDYLKNKDKVTKLIEMAPVWASTVRFLQAFALRPASNLLLLHHAADLLSVVNGGTSRPLATPCLARAWEDSVDVGIGDVLQRVAADDRDFVPEVWIQDMCEKVSVLHVQQKEPTAWMEEQIASLVANDFAACADSSAVLFFMSMVNPLTTLVDPPPRPALHYARSSDIQVLRPAR